MKNCPECGKPVPANLIYCGICGASISQSQNSRRERFLFFITPFFLVLLCVALSYELGVVEPVEKGLFYAGVMIFIFMGAAGIFGVITWMFSLPVLAESYWYAGMLAIAQFAGCFLLLQHVELSLLGEVLKNIGPVSYVQARVEILAVTFLPLAFCGLLTLPVRAKALRFPESAGSPSVRLILKNLPVFLPLLTFLTAGIFHFSLPDAASPLIKGKLLHDLSAYDMALKRVENGLRLHSEYAPLHFLKAVVIIDGQPEGHTPAEARNHLEKAVHLEPGVSLYLFRLSMAFDLEHRGIEAVAAAASAAALLPEDAYLWQHLGDLNLKYRNHEGAVEAFRNSLRHNAGNAIVLNNLAYTLLELDRELPQALEMARMSVERLPGLVFNLDTLAWALHRNGRHAEALEVMNDIFQGRTSVSPEVDFHYAMILHAMNMLGNPVQTFDELLVRPEVAADRKLFEEVFAARSQISDAVQKKAISVDETTRGESADD